MTEDIKKVVVFKDQLSKVDENNNHVIRFRIATDDLSRTSEWSPYYKLPGATIEQVSGKATQSGDIINFAWGDGNGRPQYDIFIATSTSAGPTYTYTPYSYHGTTPIHSYSITKPTGVTRVKFIVQVSSYEQTLSYPIEIYPRDGGAYTEAFTVA